MKLFHIILHLLRKKSVFQRREQLPQKAFSARNLSFTPQRWFCTDDFKQHIAGNPKLIVNDIEYRLVEDRISEYAL